jgi:DNA-binding NarL/FixJ family response regulator
MRVALITSEPVFRLGFRSAIKSSGDLHLISDAGDARTGFQSIDVQKPDVVVMDFFLSGMNGICATREIMRRSPGTRVLLLGEWRREQEAIEAVAAGARGLALKGDDADTLLDAVRWVGKGQLYLAPVVRRLALRDGSRPTPGATATGAAVGASVTPKGDVLSCLSTREREVLDLIVRGWHNPAIGRELCVSVKTVATHRTRIHRKLGCHSGADLIRFAAMNDLLRRPLDGPQDGVRPTVVVMVDEKTPLPEVVQERFPAATRPLRAADIRKAVAELQSSPARSMFVIDKSSPAVTMPLLEDSSRKPPMSTERPVSRTAVCRSL